MADLCVEPDAAVEQLYDELVARMWAIHRIVDADITDVTRPDVASHLAAAARDHVSALVENGVDDGIALERLLWPNGARPVSADPWWSTPLGQLISTASMERLHGLTSNRDAADHSIAS